MSVVGGMELGRGLVQLLAQINNQIDAVEQEAKKKGISPHDMRDSNGNWALTPLLAAKAQALHALVLVNQRRS